MSHSTMPDLSRYTPGDFERGASSPREACWRLLQDTWCRWGWLRGFGSKRWLLRRFGARVGLGVVLKPAAKITFPWKLELGDHCWIGEEAWILNLAPVRIGSNVCISQRAFLCAGSHDWSDPAFGLVTRPIAVEDGVWICANVFVGPGVTIGRNAVITAGSVVIEDMPAGMVCSGNPCVPVHPRRFHEASND
jgi:putative colanic acid biosynthesis acetyltransferase WcaF